ncbi:MAG: hypothetical protein BRD25_04290, partial [Bacteroidetes bacterium QH_1_61_8]
MNPLSNTTWPLLNLCLLITIVGFVTGCDSNNLNRPEGSEDIVEVKVDSEGGNATSSDGKLNVDISSGAVDGKGVLQIEKISPSEAPGNANSPTTAYAGNLYDISLKGTNLTSAAEIRFESPDDNGDGIADGTDVKVKYGGLAFWSAELDDWIEPSQVYDAQSGEHILKTNDFSIWGYFLESWSTPQELRWKVTSLPTNVVSDVDRTKVENDIEFAFNVWEVETGRAGLTFTKVSPGSDADIVIEFGAIPWVRKVKDWFSEDAVAFTTPGQGKIIFNDELSWPIRERASSSLSIAEVGMHEVGHAIGLVHACRDCTEPPIMASDANNQKNLSLSPGDVAQVRDLYDISDLQLTGHIRGSVTDASTEQPLGDVTVKVRDANDNVAGLGLTEQDGSYQIPAPEAEGYTVAFSKNGYLPVTYDNVSVVSDQDTYLEPVLQVNNDN